MSRREPPPFDRDAGLERVNAMTDGDLDRLLAAVEAERLCRAFDLSALSDDDLAWLDRAARWVRHGTA